MSPRSPIRRAVALALALAAAAPSPTRAEGSGVPPAAPAPARAEGSAAPPAAPSAKRTIARIQLRGDVLDRGATLAAAGIAEGGELDDAALAAVAARVRAFYVDRGFPEAVASADATGTDDPSAVVLSIEVSHGERGARALGPGAPRTIDRRIFVIEPRLDAEVGELKQRYRLGRGARADGPALADADRELTDVLRQNGFYRAEVRHLIEQTGAATALYVYLDTGPRVVPVFDGNRAFDDDQLRDALGLGGARETKPQELVDRLHTFYVDRGFLDAEVSGLERGGPADAVHYLELTVREHQQVHVTRRVFPCLSGELTPDAIGGEIQSFLEEELPGGDPIGPGDPGVVTGLFGPTEGAGGRAVPLPQNPATTYAPETYDRALAHLRDLFQSKGYLNAVVGPIGIVRATCQRSSPPGRCVPETPPLAPPLRCPIDAFGLPRPVPDLPDALTCRPDPRRGIECAPEMTVRIPIHLGPRTTLYDLAFEGAASFSERQLARVAELDLGQPLSTVALDAARLRLLDAYRDAGFAYAEVRTAVEPSPDRTRARVRFVLEEGPLVTVTGFVLRGATRTDEALVLGRMALRRGGPYGQKLVRASEERIATLGTFSSVTIALERPDLHEPQKRVVITVVEQLPQYLEPRIGFSTGDGLRFGFDYGHRNIGGQAVGLSLSTQLSYLFDFMILEPALRKSYDAGDCHRDSSGNLACQPLQVIDRLEQRSTVTVSFPEIGIGPLVGLSVDGLFVRDNQRDFGLTKRALVPSLLYRPRRTISAQLGASLERNDVQTFNADSVEDAIRKNASLASLLRVPDGATFVVAERLSAAWDRRDNPFDAKSGTIISGGVEHVNAFPSDSSGASTPDFKSNFLRLTSRAAVYVRLSRKGTSLAMSLSAGYNLALDPGSRTYPDRLFFLGGVDSLRAFLADSVVPEDIAQRLLRDAQSSGKAPAIDAVGIRGGDLALNPRFELRVPYSDAAALGLFLDTGNLWRDPSELDLTALRYAAGAGLRFSTPIGPLALDYGVNLVRRSWEDFGAFHFSIGLF